MRSMVEGADKLDMRQPHPLEGWHGAPGPQPSGAFQP
jgi:hypothetical protein